MGGIPDVGAVVGRVVATAQNGLEVLRLGGLETGTQPAPFAVVETEKMFKLRRYFPGDDADGPNVVLIPPMMVSANVYDVTEHNGAVSILHRHGIVPWVIDFGSPDTVEGGMERDLADHVVAVSRAIDLIIDATGKDVHLAGYSQGGMFAYQTAAYRRSKGLASLITFGSPVDVLAGLPLGLPAGWWFPVPRSSPIAWSVICGYPDGWRAWDSRCSTRSRPHAADWTSCGSSTTATPCCRVKINGASSNPTAGSRGPARRSRSCCDSSSFTTAWCPVDSSSTVNWSLSPRSPVPSSRSSARPTTSASRPRCGDRPRRPRRGGLRIAGTGRTFRTRCGQYLRRPDVADHRGVDRVAVRFAPQARGTGDDDGSRAR